jgi:hypothetical protein
LKEELQKYHDSTHANPLSLYDVKTVSKLCTAQAQTVSEIRSTLNFTDQEGFQTRSVLVSLYKEKSEIIQEFDKELAEYAAITGGKSEAIIISKAFCPELIYHLDKSAKRLRKETVSQ